MMVKERPVSRAHSRLLEQVYETHRQPLLDLVQQRLSAKLAAHVRPEDIVQNAYLKARQRWEHFQLPEDNPEAACFAWLREIVLHCLYDEWDYNTAKKRDVRREQVLPERSSVFERLGLASPQTGPSTAAARNEQEERLHELLGQLKPADREILQMIEFEARSYAEVAVVLQIDNGAARVRHTRALRRLKDLWKQTFPEGEQP